MWTAERWRAGRVWRGNVYGVSWSPTWPHVSLGISAHLGSRFAHLSLHLPFGLLLLGCTGAADRTRTAPLIPCAGTAPLNIEREA